MTAQNNTLQFVCGAVVLVDIDNYLRIAEDWDLSNEAIYLARLYASMEELACAHGFVLCRTFGDGFLFYKKAAITDTLLNNCRAFLVSARDLAGQKSLEFKAALVAGEFCVEVRRRDNCNIEHVLTGAVVNFAGKLLGVSARATLLISWPAKGQPLCGSYKDISIGRNVSAVPISQLEFVSRSRITSSTLNIFSMATALDEPSAMVLTLGAETKKTIVEMIKIADDKAKTVFAASAGVAAYLFTSIPQGPISFDLSMPLDAAMLIRALAICTLLSCCGFALGVILPRMNTQVVRGRVFFGSIAAWGSAAEYAADMAKLRRDDIIRENSIHNYEISWVTVRKYRFLRLALIAGLAGFVMTLIHIVVTKIGVS